MSNLANPITEALNAEKKRLLVEFSTPERAARYIEEHGGNGEKGTGAFEELSDAAMASAVRMLMRDDFIFEGCVTAARDRICRLSKELAEARSIIAGNKIQPLSEIFDEEEAQA